MRRILAVLMAAFLVVLVSAPAGNAASPHFKKKGDPNCTVVSTSAPSASTTCTGTMAGLGNGDVTFNLAVSGFAVYQCQNGGGNIAPGANKVLTGPASSSTSVPADAIKNGNLTFTTNPAVLTADPTVAGAVAGCPNPNWTGVNPTLTVTSIVLDIFQGGTQLFHCTASDPNGISGTVVLSC